MRYTGARGHRNAPDGGCVLSGADPPPRTPHPGGPADAEPRNWIDAAPERLKPFLRLSRFDRPIGFWLLALPCLIGVVFVSAPDWIGPAEGVLAALFGAGAVAMRGAGCTYNDILDRHIDAQVARTAGRPLPSCAVSVSAAWAWLGVQCLGGLAVLLALPPAARFVALGALPLVALYPLMKRITWWPQVWLGLTFNWGVLVATAARSGDVGADALFLYVGLAAWTVGYDTIYAIQDREDDALIGVRSTARRFGRHVRAGVAGFYSVAALLVATAGFMAGGPVMALATAPFALHLALQLHRLRPDDGVLALHLFRSNREAALLLLAGWGFAPLVN